MRVAVGLLFLLASCAPGVTRTCTTKTNVYLAFSSDWNCALASRETCQRQIASYLGRTFARYDVSFWTVEDPARVDGITVFFETDEPDLWGLPHLTVGRSVAQCAPKTRDGLITGTSVIFHCGDHPSRGTLYCAGVVAHEIGHIVGLEHVAGDDLMNAIPLVGYTFGRYDAPTTEGRCRITQNDSELLWAAFGEAPGIR